MFSRRDEEQLRERGVSLEEAERQIRLLRRRPSPLHLVRPCAPGDGLQVHDRRDDDELLAAWGAAAAAGRCSKFVPASGAATRMFRDLIAGREADRPTETVATFIAGLDRLALREPLARELARRGQELESLRRAGRHRPILAALLDPDGLDCAGRPKALLPFHDYPGGARTPLEEHLVEAAELVRDGDGIARLHLTISPEHEASFHDLLDGAQAGYESRLGVRLQVSFSTQSPATDTLALDAAGEPFREEDGRLLFRAAGHGALLSNLEGAGDLVLLKNVDNVAPDRRKEPTYRWSRLLLGRLAGLQERVFDLLRRLDGGEPAARQEALDLARETFHRRPAGSDRLAVRDLLDRPIRVCGMVPNEGEPGGGPFWVLGADGSESLQIVESAQVDRDSPEQQAIFAAASHFNPVFLACGLRDRAGRPYPLERWVDREASLRARKSAAARELLALERPGLWNGGMAGWNTVFVEVPGAVFTPVKTILDLLRPEHLGG